MRQRTLKYLTHLLYAAAGLGGAFLALHFLLPWLAPFLVSLALAALLEPAVRLLVHHGWRRRAAAAVLTLLLLAAVIWGLTELTARGLAAVTAFARQSPALIAQLGQGFAALEERGLQAVAAAPEEVSAYLQLALDGVGEALSALPARLSQWALDTLARLAQSGPDVLLFAVTAGIGTWFVSARFPETLAFFAAQLPAQGAARLSGLGRDLRASFGGLLRSQLILMAMTFFELLLVFLLLGIPGAPGLAAVTALIDALPVFGTGTVLLPWAAWCLLAGRTGRAAGLAAAWAGVNLVRSCTQAKLLGDQIGLDPLASLVAVYVGWRVWRLRGMLLFPVVLVTLQQLNDKGVIKLWKNP